MLTSLSFCRLPDTYAGKHCFGNAEGTGVLYSPLLKRKFALAMAPDELKISKQKRDKMTYDTSDFITNIIGQTVAAEPESAATVSLGNTEKTTEYNIIPMPNDVLCGRGAETNRHEGNVRYRMLVKFNKRIYLMARKGVKNLVAQSIVKAIHELSPPGRFLQKDCKTGLWTEVNEHQAVTKTGQTLREGAKSVRNEMAKESSDDGCTESACASAANAKLAETIRKKALSPYSVVESTTSSINGVFRATSTLSLNDYPCDEVETTANIGCKDIGIEESTTDASKNPACALSTEDARTRALALCAAIESMVSGTQGAASSNEQSPLNLKIMRNYPRRRRTNQRNSANGCFPQAHTTTTGMDNLESVRNIHDPEGVNKYVVQNTSQSLEVVEESQEVTVPIQESRFQCKAVMAHSSGSIRDTAHTPLSLGTAAGIATAATHALTSRLDETDWDLSEIVFLESVFGSDDGFDAASIEWCDQE